METASLKSSDTGVEVDSLTDDDIIIAVLGPTGAGKSSFISMATGGDEETIGHGLNGHTQKVRAVRRRDPCDPKRRYVFLDTPGFDDTYLSDTDILIEISIWLNATYKRRMLISGILYLHRISDNRMTGSALRNMHMFNELCGDVALPNVILVTTMWNEVQGELPQEVDAPASGDEEGDAKRGGVGPQDQEAASKREEELRTTFWDSMIGGGSRIERFRHTPQSAWDIARKVSTHRLPLQLQTQMVDDHIPLSKTSAGTFLNSWLNVLSNRLKELSEWFQSKQRTSFKNPVHATELERERRTVDDKIKQVKVQLDRLDVQSLHSSRSVESSRISDPASASTFVPESDSSPTAPSLSSFPMPPLRGGSMPSNVIRAVFPPTKSHTLPGTAQNITDTKMWEKYSASGTVPAIPSLEHHPMHIPPMRAEAKRHFFNPHTAAHDDTNDRIPECAPEPRSFWIDLYPVENIPEPERPRDSPAAFLDLEPIDEEYVLVDDEDEDEPVPAKLQRTHMSFRQKSRHAASKLLSRSSPLGRRKPRGRSMLSPGLPDAATSAQRTTGPSI